MNKITLLILISIVFSIPTFAANYKPILIDDDNEHRIWTITGASSFSDLNGVNLNDGIGIDLVQVGSYSKGYNLQAIAYGGDGNLWALGMGLGPDGAQNRHAYIGQISESGGVYSFGNIMDTGFVYTNGDHGKALIWDANNDCFIFEANTHTFAAKTELKCFDPVSKTIVSNPWSSGGTTLSFDVPGTGGANYVQGLAFSPDGTLYGSIGYSPSILIKFEKDANNKFTGNISTIGSPDLGIGANNIEAIDFTQAGQFIVIQSNSGSSSSGNPTAGKVYIVDTTTGVPTEAASLNSGLGGVTRDWEGIRFNPTPYNPQECKVNPKIVFILDDSGSIDNVERSQMETSLQSIADKIEIDYPNAEFGVVQYGTPPNPTTPEAGTYDIVMNYTTNPTFSITDNPSLLEDHLPDSIDQMITDNIFTTGTLSNPDAFFIFTDALRDGPNGGVCCSNLGNTLNNVSSDAESGFGEYSKLAALASTGNVSLYQVLPAPADTSPEIVQGNGVHQVGSFALAQASIDAIADSLCSTTPPVTSSCAVTPNFQSPVLESGTNKQVGATYRFGNVSTNMDALVEILNINNANIGKIDDTSSGSAAAFQPELLQDHTTPGVAVPDQHVDFEIRFVNAGTNTPVTLPSLQATAVDIDGDNFGTREYTILQGADSYVLEDPTNLESPSSGHFRPYNYNNNNGISLTATEQMVTANYTNVSSIRYTTGFTNNGVDDYKSYHRQSSLSFECANYNNPVFSDPPEICYAINDDNTSLYKFDLDPSTAPTSVAMSRVFNGEAFAYRSTDNALYAFNQAVKSTDNPSDLYKIELDGSDTLIASNFIPKRAAGAEFVSYSDGTEQLMVLIDESDSFIQFFDATDLASKTPLKTLNLIYADGSNAQHLDGLAVNPTTGEVLLMESYEPALTNPKIYSVNIVSGVLTLKVTLAATTPRLDAESFTFTADGNAYTEAEHGSHRIYRIDLVTGAVTEVERANLAGDIEGLTCNGSSFLTPPPVQRCPSSSTSVINGLKIGVPNSPWPADPSISYTLTATNYQATIPNISAYQPPGQGIIRGAKDGDFAHKQVSSLPVTLNLKLSQPVPANQFYFYAQDIEAPNGNDNAATINVISGTATPADFIHGSWSSITSPGVYDPLTGKVTMTNPGDTSTGDQGMFWLLGATSATVQELEISTGSFTSAGDYVGHILTNVGCTVPSISGSVFKDDNTNDVFDATESGIANISVWAQLINADGTIDPTKIQGSTNSQGYYEFYSLADGDYQVHVDVNDSDLLAVVLGGTNPLSITVSGNSVTDVNFPFDPMICTALSDEISEAALLSPASVSKGDFVIVPSTSVTPNEVQGHLRAYELDSKGTPKTTAKWDANEEMTKKIRQNSRLYSTVGQGKSGIATFASLDTTLFGVSSDQASIIKGYTIDPSKDSGKYLAGRKSGSYLGSISRNNGIALLNDAIDTFQYLDDTDYQSYYSKYVKSRDEKVFLGSDDGFIYSFDYDSGELAWGWMPSSLVKELKDYTTFQSNQFMRGKIDTFDLKSAKGYHPYIVGTYKGGLGHYVLKLDKASSSKSNLKSVVWESDASDSFISSPNRGQMEYFTDDNGLTYIAFIMTDSNFKSTLFIRSLTDNKKLLEIPLDFNVTSTPFIMFDFKKHTAPTRKTLYLGDDNGNIYSAPLLNSKGELESLKSIKDSLEGKKVASLASIGTDPVLFIGASVSLSNNQYYLRAQSSSRLSVFKYDSSKKGWNRQWTTAVQSSEKINSDGSVTSNPSSIQVLPIDSKITDNSYIVSDSIVLPVNEVDLTTSSCSGKGYYYLYKLTDGSAPQKTFLSADDTYITGKVYLGYGNPTRIVLGDLPQKDTLAGYGHTDQKDDNTTGISQTVFIKDSFPTGIRSWRVIDDMGY